MTFHHFGGISCHLENGPTFQKVAYSNASFLNFYVHCSVVSVEYSEENTLETKYQLLRSLHRSMASKYKMTLKEFNDFSLMAYEALSDSDPF